MVMPRHKPKRDASEPEIVQTLQALGCSVYRLDTPVDLLVGYRGATHLAECKIEGAKLNENQKAFIAGWRGAPVTVLYSSQDAMDWIVELRNERQAAA